MHLRVARLGTDFRPAAETVSEARAEFDRGHCLRLPGFVEAGLLAMVQDHLARSATVEADYERIGSETSLGFGASTAALDLALNDPRLFDIVRQLTGAGPIGCFIGRIYQMQGGNEGFHWHNDMKGGRLIGLSINLGDTFGGGILQIADAETKTIVSEVANVVAGDAVMFRIADAVVHRVTPVEGPATRTAYSGWFCSSPSYREILRTQWRVDAT